MCPARLLRAERNGERGGAHLVCCRLPFAGGAVAFDEISGRVPRQEGIVPQDVN